MWPLKSLFHTMSGAWPYLVHPPGIKASSVFICFNNFLTSCYVGLQGVPKEWTFFKGNIPKTCLKNFKTNSSFIQSFDDDTTTHPFLNSSFGAVALCLALWKTIKGFNFVSSAFVVKHMLTLTFSFPVERHIFCSSGIDHLIPNHVRPNSSFVHCNYTIWWKVCFHRQPSYMHNILDQLSCKVGRIVLRYCCLPLHRKVALFLEFHKSTITSNKSSFQLFIVTRFFIINRFSFKHVVVVSSLELLHLVQHL